MLPNSDICYKALCSHDRRFDGRFFVGVKSTGIYCRTVCTAKTPLAKNCLFFQSAAQAEVSGFRPCLRCRPELAPGQAPVDSISRTAFLISKQIESGALNQMSVAELAESLGMSERHLRRVVEAGFGVGPLELAQTQRLMLAKRLLEDSNISISELAFASGFNSLRRFNALFKERYGLSPSELRRTASLSCDSQEIKSRLYYRPPFDWRSVLEFLERRLVVPVEFIEDQVYYRAVHIGGHRGILAVKNLDSENCLQLSLSLSFARVMMPILAKVRRMFDLDACPDLISSHLGKLAEHHPGLRIPGAFDEFETCVRGILGQQVTVKAATTLMARFCRQFGEPIDSGRKELERTFPSAKFVAELNKEELTGLGIVSARVDTILALARALAGGAISLDLSISPEQTIERLKEIPGIGDWTANYIAMRVLSYPDAFPYSDLGIKKALGRMKEREIIELAEKWRPWRAYAAMQLWKGLED